MNWQAIFYISLYIASLVVSLTVGIFAWNRRTVRGARAFAIYALAEASMILGFVLELLAPSLEAKIFWDDFQFIGTLVVPIALLSFSFQFTQRKSPPQFVWWAMGGMASLFLILVYTDPLHGLIRPESLLISREPFTLLMYDYTLTFWTMTVVVYSVVIYCIGIFVVEFLKAEHLYRAQIGIVLVGIIFPLLGATFSISGIETPLPRDVMPFGFALGNLVIAWGVFRYRLFELVPVARRLVLKNMVDAVMVLDAEARVADLNPAAERIIGRDRSKILGQPTDIVFDRWPDLLARFRGVQETQAEVSYILAGEERYASLTISPLYDEQGQLAGRVLVARDITERKRAEEALRQSAARYRLLAENTSDHIVRLDHQGNVLFATDASFRFHGYAPHELMGTSGFDRIHLDDRAEVSKAFEHAIEVGEDTRYEYRLRRKDGGYMWVETTGRLVHNPELDNPEVVLVIRDITARRAAEQALQRSHDELERRVEERTAELRESEAALRRAQAVSHTGSWSLDIPADRLVWSDEAYRIFGIPLGTPMTYPLFLEHVHPEDRERVDGAWNSALQREINYDIEHRILVNGEQKWVREQAEIEFDEDGQSSYAVGTVQDITARKERMEQLRQYTERLQTLYQISDGIVAAHSSQSIAQVAMGYIRQLIPCMGVVVAVIERPDDEIVFLAADLESQIEEEFDLATNRRMLYSDVSKRLQRGDIYIAEFEQPRSTLKRALYAAGARAACHIPLLVQQELIGSMVIIVRKQETLTEGRLDIVRRVADQLAIAIHQAQLREQAQQYAEELEQMNRALALLNEASRAFSSTLDQDQVFSVVLEEARRLLDIDAIVVWLPDPQTEELVCRQAAGAKSDLLRGWRIPSGESIAGWVAQHAESQIVPDVEKDERYFSKGAERTGMTVRSVLAIPLRFKDDVVGVLQAVGTEVNCFNADDLALMESLAASAVIAIDNARLFEEVRDAREQLQALSRNLVDIQEAERAAVARELHDEAGQSLSYLLLSLGMLEREAENVDAVKARARVLEGMLEALLENLHRLAVRLRPVALDHLGLTPALEQYVETFVNQYDIDIQFAAIGLGEERLPSEIETALYRVVQEALTNVVRHAEASHVDVILERRDAQIVLIVEDDGIGFDAEHAAEQGRLGLVGMRERAQMLGGTWTIESRAGAGTTIVVEVPHDYSDSDRG